MSARPPAASVRKLATMAAVRCTCPRNGGPAPSDSARKAGLSGKIISVPASVKGLVRPSRTTATGSFAAGGSARALSARDIGRSLPRATVSRVSVALFVRHGKASAFAGDYDQLSPPGVEQSEQLGRWLARDRVQVDAVFVGPRKRHAQTHEAVVRFLASHGFSLPEPALVPDLDEDDGPNVVSKLLPELAAADPPGKSIVAAT